NRKSRCGCSSMAERQLPKLHTGVRFPSPAEFIARTAKKSPANQFGRNRRSEHFRRFPPFFIDALLLALAGLQLPCSNSIVARFEFGESVVAPPRAVHFALNKSRACMREGV